MSKTTVINSVNKKAKKKGGRPTKMTSHCVKKLEDAFIIGATDSEACSYADITRQTLYNYCDKNDGFLDRKEVLKSSLTLKAKMIISAALDDGDLATAHKVIDRKEGQRIKQEISSKEGNPLTLFIQQLSGNTLEPKSN